MLWWNIAWLQIKAKWKEEIHNEPAAILTNKQLKIHTHASMNRCSSYHSREWCSSINLCFCRSSETAFSVSGVSSFCSMSPVTTHPFCEVAIVVFIIVHNDSRQEPERHGGVVWGKCDPGRVVQRVKTGLSWPTKPLTGCQSLRLLYYTLLCHKAKVTHFN